MKNLKEKKIKKKFQSKIEKLENSINKKEDVLGIATGTSKTNYNDP